MSLASFLSTQMAVEQAAPEPAPGPQLPQGPVFHEENSEQEEHDMNSQPSKFITTRVSGVRTESHEPKPAASDATATYVSLPGAPMIPPGVYFPPYPPAGVYSPQLPQAPATASDSTTPPGHTPTPSQIPPGSYLSIRPSAGSSTSTGSTPSLAAIYTQGSNHMLSPDSAATPSTATSLPSAAPPFTPDGSEESPGGGDSPYTPGSVPRLPPILQVEKVQVTTTATQAASASRRRNEAHFVCPVPGCGSTFTRRFNLRGHLRSHTEERPYVCEWPGCSKGFARQHDCKRHQALHSQRTTANVCHGCRKTFSRLDALNRHLRSDGGADCRMQHAIVTAATAAAAEGGGDLPPPFDPSTSDSGDGPLLVGVASASSEDDAGLAPDGTRSGSPNVTMADGAP